jgi:hypothetical protein
MNSIWQSRPPTDGLHSYNRVEMRLIVAVDGVKAAELYRYADIKKII